MNVFRKNPKFGAYPVELINEIQGFL